MKPQEPHRVRGAGAFYRTGKRVKKSHRKLIVFSTLLGVLSLTSALLMALAPAPLVPSRWRYLYIHHSQTPAGNAITLGQATGGLGDHFVIGNGDGLMDGEIQVGQRWNQQQVALPPLGANKIDPACISIGLVGD